MTAKAPTHCPGTHCHVCNDVGERYGWFGIVRLCPNCKGNCLETTEPAPASIATTKEILDLAKSAPARHGILTLLKGDEDIYRKWQRAALADDTVWPWLGRNQHFEFWDLRDNDWLQTLLMDSTETAILRLNTDRTGNSIDCGIWSLNRSEQQSAVASLLALVPGYCLRYGKEYIDGGCHATNEPSVRLHRKIFGEACGRFEKSRWDALRGEWVDGLSYRARIADVVKRYNPATDK